MLNIIKNTTDNNTSFSSLHGQCTGLIFDGLFDHNSAAKLVTGINAYIDTVQILIDRSLYGAAYKNLCSTCRSVIRETPTKQEKQHHGYKKRIRIHGPTHQTYVCLQGIYYKKYCINRVCFAVDYHTATPRDADQLKEFFRHHLVQPWRGLREMREVKNTLYWAGDPSTNRSYKAYSDKLSRFDGSPVGHLEFSIKNAATCRRYEFRQIQDFFNVDHRAIWERELRLKSIDPKKLDKCIRKRAGVEFTEMRKRGRGGLFQIGNPRAGQRGHRRVPNDMMGDIRVRLVRALRTQHCILPPDQLHFVPAQALSDEAPWAKPSLVAIPHEWMLP